MDSTSKIAQIRERIDRELEALQQLKHGFATVASHELITHHMEALGNCFEALVAQVGERAAIETLAQRVDQLI
jgi:hypothetical protein